MNTNAENAMWPFISGAIIAVIQTAVMRMPQVIQNPLGMLLPAFALGAVIYGTIIWLVLKAF